MSKILVVDDDQQIRNMLRITLERENYQVIEACDGFEAAAAYRAQPIDLVITDIVMPDKEGIELIMELKGIAPDVRIIAISGGGRINPEDYLKWARRFGVEHTFSKPVDRQKLLDAVAILLTPQVA
jgi:YesN/AraC family two-component response regulator